MNPLQPNVFAQHPMTYGNVDPLSGMEATQTAVTHRDEQIRNLLYRENCTLRTINEAQTAIRNSPWEVPRKQIRQMLKDAGARTNQPRVSEEEIVKRLYKENNGPLRSCPEVLKVLHADGLGSNHSRITRLRKEAKGEKE